MTQFYEDPILFTGATGFMGHYVLRDLLVRGGRFVVLVRPPVEVNADRLMKMLQEIGLETDPYISSGALQVVAGALPDDLPEPSWGRTSAIIHCAASLQLFSNGNGDPEKTNLDGTRAIIDWAERQGVQHIHAVSTAYSCGWNTGTIPERFHEPRPEFQTDYERTKWQSEKLLVNWSERPGRTLTLYRPSFLIGDSETGHTTQFAGFYQFARLLGVLKEQYHDPNNGALTRVPLRIPGRPEDRQNLIPVDYVARVMATIVSKSQYHGRIYHLTNPDPPTNEMMKRCYEEHYGLCGGTFADPEKVVGQFTTTESILWDQYNVLTPRLVHTPRFDTTNTEQVVRENGIEFPTLDQPRLLRMLDFAAQQNWGRKNGHNGRHPST